MSLIWHAAFRNTTRNTLRIPSIIYRAPFTGRLQPVSLHKKYVKTYTGKGHSSVSTFKSISDLGKLKLNFMVTITTVGSAFCAFKSGMPLDIAVGAVIGTSLPTFMVAVSSAMMNQVKEKEFDAKMERTANRPLVTGVFSAENVKLWSWGLGMTGVSTLMGLNYMLLSPGVSPYFCLVAPSLSAITWLVYVYVYTPLKRVTKFNTEVGAVVGAIPPLIGWFSMQAPMLGFDCMEYVKEPICLFALLYFWQIQHFMLLANRYREQYKNGGFQMRQERELEYGLLFGILPLLCLRPLAYFFDVVTLIPGIVMEIALFALGVVYRSPFGLPAGFIVLIVVLFLFLVGSERPEKGSEWDRRRIFG